uniref:Uncharacterized protein n=1 Tax=Glossina pallidipes TaxID=7398 RepID=A0A1A9ZND9_GLOPL
MILIIFFDRQPCASTVTSLIETYDLSRVLECHLAYRSPHLNLYHVLLRSLQLESFHLLDFQFLSSPDHVAFPLAVVYSFLPLFTAENGGFLIGVGMWVVNIVVATLIHLRKPDLNCDAKRWRCTKRLRRLFVDLLLKK